MRILFILLLLSATTLLRAQPPKAATAPAPVYLLHLTMKNVHVGNDSVVFKGGKTWIIPSSGKSDTLEVATVSGTPVAIVIDIQKVLVQKRVQYRIGYAFFKKSLGKWEKVNHFGYTERYDLLKAGEGFEKKMAKKPAREEYSCQWGYPTQFSAAFLLDVYRK